VVGLVEPVCHGYHVVEPREEDVAVTVSEQLCEVRIEPGLQRLKVDLTARFGRHCPRAVVVNLDVRYLRVRHYWRFAPDRY